MQTDYSIAITTYPNKEAAKRAAVLLVEQKLAACVQMFPVESVYFWQGEICDDKEVLLFIKSKTVLFDKIAAVIRENHTYEVPEIVQVPICGGLPEYLNWIDGCTL